MYENNFGLTILLVFFLGMALLSDVTRRRIPNIFVLCGLLASLVVRGGFDGLHGVTEGMAGMLLGFVLFIPFYVLGGMAAGDVKLISMVGAFLGPIATAVAVAFTLIFGAICGFLIVAYHRQLIKTVKRYWLIFWSRTYFAPDEDDAANKRFPYSIAVSLGTLTSSFLIPIVQ